MGLRVILYTPEDTSDDAASGVLGLIVVFARRNVVKPDTLKLTPLAAITRAMAPRARAGISQEAVIREIPHMRKATITATAGGGILSSSVRRFMMDLSTNCLARASHKTPFSTSEIWQQRSALRKSTKNRQLLVQGITGLRNAHPQVHTGSI